MAIVISFASEKGGVSKTSCSINVATILATNGKKVLLCDMDEQANATYMLTGLKKKTEAFKGKGIYDMLRAYGLREVDDYVSDSTISDNLKIIASNGQTPLAIGQLETLEQENGKSKNQFFMERVATLNDKYDYIICDTAPSRNALTTSALVASDYVVIPCVCDDFSLDGLETTYSLMRKLQKDENVEIKLLGILLTIVEKYTLTDFVRNSISESDYSDALFKTEIRKGQSVKDSLSFGKPVVLTAPKSGPAKDYQLFTKEMLARIKAQQ